MNKRYEVLDIAKGIGIFLVVYAHAYSPFYKYIVQFHMPFFFIISGYLYNEKSDIKSYMIKKVKRLYIPYVFWNLIGMCILAIISSEKYPLIQFVKQIILIIFTGTTCELFGPTWFLGTLFLASVIYKVVDVIINKMITHPGGGHKGTLFAFLLIGVLGFCITFPYSKSRMLILSMFYAIGVFLKNIDFINIKIKPFYTFIFVILSGVCYYFIVNCNSVDLKNNNIKYRLLYVIGVLCASYITFIISKILMELKYVKDIIMYIGRNSIDILIWHLNFFRVVILFQLLNNNISVKEIMNYYPIYSSDGVWWIVYTVIGIAGSLIIGSLLKKGIWGKWLKRIYVV